MRVIAGDCLAAMATLARQGELVDAIVTDPPYGLEFMGKDWDKLDAVGKNAKNASVWRGRHGKGGSSIGDDDSKPSTRHHVALGIKKHGFKRCIDCGKRQFSGSPCKCAAPHWIVEFPQQAALSTLRMQSWHETWARAAYRVLKPGGYLLAFGGTRTHHRLFCAIEDAGFVIQDTIMWLYGTGFPKGRTQLKPAFEPIVVAYKPGAARMLQVDECRIPTDPGDYDHPGDSGAVSRHDGRESWRFDQKQAPPNPNGRWPANVCHDGRDEVMAAFAAFGETKSVGGRIGNAGGGSVQNIPVGKFQKGDPGFGDTGSAARFFYCAKASKTDRAGSKHPTIKPVALMRWLVRLVTPLGGVVLDPFAGSSTTGAAALADGRDAILIEREAEYIADIHRRLKSARRGLPAAAREGVAGIAIDRDPPLNRNGPLRAESRNSIGGRFCPSGIG